VISPLVIAGGGLAGAAAAALLSRAGVKVTVIEREPGPTDKMCGEFLSVEAQSYIAALGLDLAPLGGHPISRLTLVRQHESVDSPLPFTGLGVSRRVLDEALLDHASRCGATVLRGHRINSVTADDGITLDVDGIGQIRPEILFLSTGKHDLRGLRRNAPVPEDLVGFKMYFRLNIQAEDILHNHIALILFNRGYAGLQLVEGGQTNLCLLADRSRLQEAAGGWPGLLRSLSEEIPYLSRMLSGAEPVLEKPLTIYRVPYGFIHRPMKSDPAGIFRLGDQAAVIPSFTGDGMAIALHSAAVAVAAYLKGETAAAYHHRLFRDISGQVGRAGKLYDFASGGATQRALFGLARLWPGSLRIAAALTRVPVQARLHASSNAGALKSYL
jgi:flavin-dependent dehydrogenase